MGGLVDFMIISSLGIVLAVIVAVYLYFYSDTENKKFQRWLSEGINNNLDEEKVLARFENDCQKSLGYGISNLPFGRATVFSQEFLGELSDDAEFLGFSPVRSMDKVELKEYGILSTTEGLIVKYQTNKITPQNKKFLKKTPSQFESESYILPFDGLWFLGYVGNTIVAKYPDRHIKIQANYCNAFSPDLLNSINYLIASGFTRNIYLYKLADRNVKVGINKVDEQLTEAYQKSKAVEEMISVTGNKIISNAGVGFIAGEVYSKAETSNLQKHMKDNQLNAIVKERNFKLKDNKGKIRAEFRRTGHGEAAEYANNVIDRLLLKRVDPTGNGFSKKDAKGQGVNAVDRIVNGVKIQSKYCKNPKATVRSYMNGKYSSDVALECPRDQYKQVKEMMKDINPDVKVVKGHVTYKYATNVCKAGTIPSITTDALDGIQVSVPGASLSFVIVFAQATWSGMNAKDAAKVSGRAAMQTIVAGTVVYSGSQQFAKTVLSKKIAKQIGKDAVHMAKYSSLAISGVLIYGPSVVDALRGRISMNQLMKNAGVGTTGVIGGAIGSVMGPAGAITGGIIGSAIGKKIMDVMVEDDAAEVYEIIREEFIDGVLTAGLSQKEFDNMIELTFANKKFSKMMKEVYHAGNNFTGMEQIDAQRKYARDNIIDLNIIKLYRMRNSIDENNIIEAIEIFDENLGDNIASFAFDM